MGDDMKTCNRCNESKPAEAYSIAKRSPNGDIRHGICKACRSAYQNAVYAGKIIEKACTKCRRTQAASEFRPTPAGGLTALCVTCIDKRRDYYERNGGAEGQRLQRAMKLARAFAAVPTYTRGHLSPVVRTCLQVAA